MKLVLLMIFLSSCSSYDSDSYWLGFRDGVYGGCNFFFTEKYLEKKLEWEEFKKCSSLYREADNYRKRIN